MRWMHLRYVLLAAALIARAPAAQDSERPVSPTSMPAVERAVEKRPQAASRLLAFIRRLRSDLGLDAAQQEQFDRLVETYRSKLEATSSAEDDPRALIREARSADQEGDAERASALRNRIREARAGGSQRAVIQHFLDELESFLRDEQREKLGQMRDRMLRSQPGSQRVRPAEARPFGERIAALRAELALSESQNARFDAAAEKLRADVVRENEPSIAELAQQMREAFGRGDQAEARKLRAQLQQRRERGEQALKAFAESLRPALTVEQISTVEAFRAEAGQLGRGAGVRRGADARSDPRAILRAVRRLELSQEQRDQLRPIEELIGKRTREADRDPEKLAAVCRDAEAQVRELLNADQVKQLDQALRSLRRTSGAADDADAIDADTQRGNGNSENATPRRMRRVRRAAPAESP